MKANQYGVISDNFIEKEIENIYQILNKISFGTVLNQKSENIDSYLIEATASSVIGDDTILTHELNRDPIGFIVIAQSSSANFYDGTGTNNSTNFYIKCTIPDTRFRLILV